MSAELEKRIEELERRLARAENQLEGLGASAERSSGVLFSKGSESTSSPQLPEETESIRHWIEKAGIAFLLIGVAFFLKFSYDQGWLTELARVALGTFVGAGLLWLGHYLRDRTHLSSSFMGAGIAVLYGVVYTCFEFYQLLPFVVALVLMQSITLGAILLSLRENRSILASLASIGAFSTPFLILSGETQPLLFLGIYSLIVTTAMVGIYSFRPWKSLLVVSTLGMAGLLLAVLINQTPLAFQTTELAALLFLGLAQGLLIIATALPRALSSSGPRKDPIDTKEFSGFARGQTFLAALIGVIFFQHIGADSFLIVLSYPLALTLGLLLLSLRFSPDSEVRQSLYLIAGGMTGFWLLGLLQIGPFSQLLAIIAIVANLLARKDQEALRILGVGALSILGLWNLLLVTQEAQGLPFLSPEGLHRLITLAAILVVGKTFHSLYPRWANYWAALGGFLLSTYHQFSPLESGALYTTTSWALLSLALLLLGMKKRHPYLQIMALLTLSATAAKLLFFDLYHLSPLWRMSIFLGLGIVILLASLTRKKG